MLLIHHIVAYLHHEEVNHGKQFENIPWQRPEPGSRRKEECWKLTAVFPIFELNFASKAGSTIDQLKNVVFW
jgi:hypothetical protein